MRTPDFWSRGKGGLVSALLTPAGWLWGAATAARLNGTTPRSLRVPVLCVGNLTAGGSGKTPVAISLMHRLKRRGVDAQFLTRGYGGQSHGPLKVDAETSRPEEVGDEPLLLARHATTWVGADRIKTAGMAIDAGAQALILDDGFQNPTLAKDLSVIVVDGGFGFGNGRLIPAGPLREPVATGLQRANAVVILGTDDCGARAEILDTGFTGPILSASFKPGVEGDALKGKRVLAFAGIGRPEKFFQTLRDLGADVVDAVPFADHHPYTIAQVRDLIAWAAKHDAFCVTTAKDLVRVPTQLLADIRALSVTLDWQNPNAVDELLGRLSYGR